MKKIWFDMDGTIANLYGVDGWLDCLINEDVTPYAIAAPMLNMSLLARYLNKLAKQGYEIGIISWGSKNSSDEYFEEISRVKIKWLAKHLPSVTFTHIKIERYGIDKRTATGGGILFDDELNNRLAWGNEAYEPNEIFTILKGLVS